MYDHPHRRYNPLTGEWILVSPQRSKRPWKGAREMTNSASLPAYDKTCYLCPGNKRVHEEKNPQYESTYVFTNDFQAIEPASPEIPPDENGLLKAQNVQGTCRVVCYSPRHDKTLTTLSVAEIEDVIRVWQSQAGVLGKTYRWVQVFENKGDAMGSSNPHPHSQIWASTRIPTEIEKESQNQLGFYKKHHQLLLRAYLEKELTQKVRVVIENTDWVVVVPFWALWPFETLLLPKNDIQRLEDLQPNQSKNLAHIMKQLLAKYDALFDTPFPYTMGWHFAPYDNTPSEHWLLHAHYYPPLLRSKEVKKFVVGYEMLAEGQRDITPEEAATRLREL